jgi:hypothetical protein
MLLSMSFSIKPVFRLAIVSRAQAKHECDWVVMSVASQSGCVTLFARVNSPRGKRALNATNA